MTKASKDLDRVLTLVTNLIERLRASLSTITTGHTEEAEYLFISTWGGLSITGDDADLYRACRDAIIRLHGTNNEHRLLSRRTVEKLLSDTVLRVLHPARSGHLDPRPRFEGRTKRELRKLRRALTSPLRRWQLAVEIAGLADVVLPMKVGRVRFVRGSKRTAKQIAANIFDLQPGSPRIALTKRRAENAGRQKSRDEVTEMFSKNAIALAEVAAGDSGAAKERGLSEVRLIVDVLNFFAPWFEHPVGPHRAYIAPDGRGARLRWAVYDPTTWAFSYLDDTPNEWAITKLRPTSRIARRVGLVRLNDLLARETRTDLEDRIVTAAAWAGRARVERRRDQSFLLYAIALEALLAKPGARAGVTDRLRLRVAYLVHRRAEARRTLSKTMERLYSLRSGLVHAGVSDEISDEDLKIIERVVELAVVAMLTRAPFKSMRSAVEFERWFDDRLLGG